MKSLVLLTERGTDLPGPVLALAHDAVTRRQFAAVHLPDDQVGIVVIDGNASEDSVSEIAFLPPPASVTGNEDNSASEPAAPTIACFQYLAETDSLYLAFHAGDLVSIQPADGTTAPIGSITGGVAACAWSPDEELVVIVTGLGNVMVMTRDFDLLVETPIETDEHGAQVPVSVGWGRKETQFHGSAGKQAAQARAPSEARLSPDDDRAVRIAWRGDASAFTVSSIDMARPAHPKRTVRVYARDGALQATSELVDMLEHPLAWRPAGNLVASTQRAPGGKHLVCFFEPNGLRHGEFALRADNLVVRELAWNSDSSVLCVWATAGADAGEATDVVQLWTMNNYHWYLKQSISLGAGSRIAAVAWDASCPLLLHLAATGGDAGDSQYVSMRWTWDVLRAAQTDAAHAASVGVIDGAALLHTPMAVANVPPPYSLSRLAAATPIKGAACCASPASPERVAVLAGEWRGDATLAVYDAAEGNPRKLRPVATVPVSAGPSVSLRQPILVDSVTVVALGYDYLGCTDLLVRVSLDVEAGSATEVSTTFLPFQAYRIAASNEHGGDAPHLVVEDASGQVWRATWDADMGEYALSPLVMLPTPCQWLAVFPVPETLDDEVPDLYVVGLNERSKLVLGDDQVSAECSSFALHADYLIYTTLSHTAQFLPRARLGMSSAVMPEHSRAVERGAQIVTVHPRGTGLVLQMPRGNLETVYPRPLVVGTIVAACAAGEWRRAFLLVRQHRVEMNVLVDTDLPRFLAAVPDVVDQIANPDHVNLLLSSLKEDDVIAATYPALDGPARPAATVDAAVEGTTKVGKVCDAVRAVLESRADRDAWITTTITTYVKSSPPQLEAALRVVKQLAAGSADAAVAERALKYTIFLVNVDALYDVALGMYDFSLVLMVAQKSQKDPREYLPFLNELRQLPEPYRKYRIDAHLKRTDRALAHLLRAGDAHFDEVRNFMAQHDMHPAVIAHYSTPAFRDDAKRACVLAEYADRLAASGMAADAALAFEMAGRLADAQDEYIKAGMWREAFAAAAARGPGEVDLPRLAYSVAGELRDRTEYAAAATVLLEHAGDIEAAMADLVRGSCWAEAVRVARTHDRADLVDTHVRPGVAAAHAAMLGHLGEIRGDLEARVVRLAECRAEKLAQLRALETAGYDPALNNVDAMSDTTSMLSTFTGLTLASGTVVSSRSSRSNARSGKQRRKNERKRHAGRKGSVYEEEYLLESSRRVFERLAGVKDDVVALLRALLVFDHVAQAAGLQLAYAEAIAYFGRQARILTAVPEQHPLQAQVDKFRLQNDEGLTPEMADKRLQDMSSALVAALPKLPEPNDWMLSMLPRPPAAV
ncbi:putative elongator complex protein 1 [Blastocladiella emersonii ATCC 22665]|nr:putative elongator complex protein 1 [Blastocladiella emersonii ATCC 22665]